MCKYVALFSSKGYAIGENFAQWLAHKLHITEQLAGELIDHVEDLLAICGGRDYVFFLNAGVVDRFSQHGSLYGYLLEEADMGAEAGGKLRKAILTGFESVYCLAAVRSMAIIADSWLWPMLRAIEPGDDVHILDVGPELWPRACAWLEEAAASPQTVIDGSLDLRTNLEAAKLRTSTRRAAGPKSERRAERAQIDLIRIRAAIAADEDLKGEVHSMLTAAFTAMAESVRNHASEFMPGGVCCTANITPELRKRLGGMPLTSVSAETMFARVKLRVKQSGISRHDTGIGKVLCERDGTVAWGRGQAHSDALWRQSATRWRKGSGSRSMNDERRLKGEEKAPARQVKLAKKREGRAKKASQLERLKAVEVTSTYSALTKMGNEALKDQLRIFKLLEKKTGFSVTGTRIELVMRLQNILFEKHGAKANDLADGDSGVAGRGVRQRKAAGGATGAAKSKKRKKSTLCTMGAWEWDSSEEFEIDMFIGKMVVADGETEVPGRGAGFEAGTILYKVLWKGFPPDTATWEEETILPEDYVEDYDSRLEEEEEGEEEEEESDMECDQCE